MGAQDLLMSQVLIQNTHIPGCGGGGGWLVGRVLSIILILMGMCSWLLKPLTCT